MYTISNFKVSDTKWTASKAWEPISRFYSGYVPKEGSEVKYLGFTISNDLSWNTLYLPHTEKNKIIDKKISLLSD